MTKIKIDSDNSELLSNNLKKISNTLDINNTGSGSILSPGISKINKSINTIRNRLNNTSTLISKNNDKFFESDEQILKLVEELEIPDDLFANYDGIIENSKEINLVKDDGLAVKPGDVDVSTYDDQSVIDEEVKIGFIDKEDATKETILNDDFGEEKVSLTKLDGSSKVLITDDIDYDINVKDIIDINNEETSKVDMEDKYDIKDDINIYNINNSNDDTLSNYEDDYNIDKVRLDNIDRGVYEDNSRY